MVDTPQRCESFLQSILDALPMPLFVVDNEYRMVDWNPVAHEMLGAQAAPTQKLRSGDALGCLQALEAEQGCGTGGGCSDCVLRKSVAAALKKQRAIRQRTMYLRRIDGQLVERSLLITALPLEPFPRDLALLLVEDVTEIDTLREMVPICASCKKIRNDEDYWERLEEFMGRYAGMTFSHGLCPDCAKELMEEAG